MGMFLAFHILPVDIHIALQVKTSQKKKLPSFSVILLYNF